MTGNEFYRTITEEILDYVIREVTDAAGGFYFTQDADSEGEEGRSFVWTPDEIRKVHSGEAPAFVAGDTQALLSIVRNGYRPLNAVAPSIKTLSDLFYSAGRRL